jgi:hypothetical protein
MSTEFMTDQQQTSTSCFKYEVPLTPLEELKRGNRILLTLFNIKQEQIQKMADELFSSSSELSKPVLKRGVHINEDFGLADPIEQGEDSGDSKRNWEDPDTKAQIQEYLLEQEQEQEQDDLVWSPFGHRWVTQKDYNTFEVKVEPIIKKEPVKPEQVNIKQNLFEKLLQKYKKKAVLINAIIERQEKEKQEIERQEIERQEIERQEEASRQQQEQDNFCESDHEDMREELWQTEPGQGDTVDCLLSAESIQNTFYDFAELADCFEEIDEDEQEQKQQKQQNPEQCNCLQEDPEEQCEECQKRPPKKLQRSKECDTLPPLIAATNFL